VPCSVDSDSSVESTVSESVATSARPLVRRNDSTESRSRGTEKHITPVDLEKMVTSIKENQQLEPLSPLPTTLAVHPTVTPPPTARSEKSTPRPPPPSRNIPDSSTSTVATVADTDISAMSPPVGSAPSTTATDMSSHSVVRGFEPGRISNSYRSKTQLAHTPTPILKTTTSALKSEPATKKKGATFTIGGGSSDEEAESSLETHMRMDGRDSSANSKRPIMAKKTTSFKDEVTTISRQPYQDSAIESDDEDAISESAIEDEDDDDDWEDSSDVGEAEAEEKVPTFERVPSQVNLPSRRSLLTMQMHEPSRSSSALQNVNSRSSPAIRRSRTSSPNGPSLATSPQEPPMEMAQDPQRSRARPIIMTTSNTHPPALSPRTTRRNMLSTELTESLRKNLLWERQQKNSTNNAVALKRRHTSNDVKNLQQFPGEPKNGRLPNTRLPTVREQTRGLNGVPGAATSWNHYFDTGLGEYHQKGW
jgi:hypothetical protein